MFYLGFKTIFFFRSASSKLTSLLISSKVTPFFISKYNTLISTLHGLGLCMAKGSLLSFLHFCIQKNELNGSRSSPTQPIQVLKKEIKVWCIVLNFPLQQRKMQTSSSSFSYSNLKNFIIHILQNLSN